MSDDVKTCDPVSPSDIRMLCDGDRALVAIGDPREDVYIVDGKPEWWS